VSALPINIKFYINDRKFRCLLFLPVGLCQQQRVALDFVSVYVYIALLFLTLKIRLRTMMQANLVNVPIFYVPLSDDVSNC